MAITQVGTANGGTSSTTTFSITCPATLAGDILLLEFCHRGTGNGTIAGTYDGAAFQLKHSQLFASSAYSGKTYWSRATKNHTGQTITGASLTNSCAAILTVLRGCRHAGDPFDCTFVGEQNASGDETQAAITTETDGARVCLVVVNSPDLAVGTHACTSPGALGEENEVLSTGGTDTSISHASADKASAGATGAFTWTQNDAASGSWAYAVRPEDASYSSSAKTEGIKLGETKPIGIAAFVDNVKTEGIKFGETKPIGILAIAAAILEGIKLGEITDATLETGGIEGIVLDGLKLGELTYDQWVYDKVTVDGLKLGELVKGNAAWQTSSLDGLRFGEGLSPALEFFTATLDGLKFGESALSNLVWYVAAQDGAKFGEIIAEGAGGAEIAGAVLDGLRLGDIPEINLSWNVAITDGVKFGEQIARTIEFLVSLSDGVKFKDSSRLPASGIVKIIVNAGNATVSMTVRKPGTSVSAKSPQTGVNAQSAGVTFE